MRPTSFKAKPAQHYSVPKTEDTVQFKIVQLPSKIDSTKSQYIVKDDEDSSGNFIEFSHAKQQVLEHYSYVYWHRFLSCIFSLVDALKTIFLLFHFQQN